MTYHKRLTVAQNSELVLKTYILAPNYIPAQIPKPHIVSSITVSSRRTPIFEHSEIYEDGNAMLASSLSELFFRFFTEAFEHTLPTLRNVSSGKTLYSFLDYERKHFPTEGIQEVLESPITDTEKVYSLIFGNIYQLTPAEAITRGQEYMKVVATLDLTVQEDVDVFIDPINGQYGKEFYYIVARLGYQGVYKRRITNKFENKDLRDFAYRIWATHCMDEKYHDVVLREVELKDLDSKRKMHPRAFGFSKLPIQTEKYRQYILGKSLNEIHHLIGKVPSSASADTAIAMSEKLLTDSRKDSTVNPLLLSSETYFAIHPKILSWRNSELIISTNALLFGNYKKIETLTLIKKYFETTNPNKLNEKLVTDLCFNLLDDKYITTWITNASFAEHILSLMKSVLTPEEIVTTILSVSSESPLTVGQWKLYLQNIETYKDTPVTWWMTIVRK